MSTTTRVSSPGRYEGYAERIYESWQRSSFYVEVRDGTKLAVDLYRPVSDGSPSQTAHPVIWIHTAYQRGMLGPGRQGADVRLPVHGSA